MASVFNLDDLENASILEGSICALGVFDGIHKGHAHLIDRVIERSRLTGHRSVVITFSIDPDELFDKGSFVKIMDDSSRINGLADIGVDYVLVLDFDDSLASVPYEEFMDELFGTNKPSELYVGQGFRFGANAQGGYEELAMWGMDNKMKTHEIELFSSEGMPVTSTRIRELLQVGNIEGANELLAKPYSISGTVECGVRQGREMGIRTANLSVPNNCLALSDGVYAAYADVEGGRYKVALSIGLPPTFEGERRSNIEAHLLDFDGDLYGLPITIYPKKKIRNMMRFDDIDSLIAQINRDIQYVRDFE